MRTATTAADRHGRAAVPGDPPRTPATGYSAETAEPAGLCVNHPNSIGGSRFDEIRARRPPAGRDDSFAEDSVVLGTR